MTQSSINLVKNIVGSGMLALPAGIAAFSDNPLAVVPAMAFTLFLALLSAYGFVLIAEACRRTGESTYQDVWAKTVSRSTAWIPATACMFKAAIGCISFSMILGDCLSLILSALGFSAAVANRSTVMVALTVMVLFPLCNLKSLAPLAKFSILGVLSNVYICFFVMLRCLDGSYAAASGHLAKASPAMPVLSAATGSAWKTMMNPNVAVLLSILATAFLAHYNAPAFYDQLAPGRDGRKEGRFIIVSVVGYSAAAAIFSIVMCGGFLTFGRASAGLILSNYASSDPLAAIARVAVAVSLVTAYPLTFFSMRKQFVAFLGHRGDQLASSSPTALTVGLLASVTAVALQLRNLGKLAAFAGAIFGSFLIYIAPPLMALGAHRRRIGNSTRGFGASLARLVQVMLVPFGFGIGILGAIQCLS